MAPPVGSSFLLLKRSASSLSVRRSGWIIMINSEIKARTKTNPLEVPLQNLDARLTSTALAWFR